jgi:hypothetical protein
MWKPLKVSYGPRNALHGLPRRFLGRGLADHNVRDDRVPLLGWEERRQSNH